MEDIPPHMIAVTPQPNEDGGWYSGPDQLEPVVAVAVSGAYPAPSSIFYEKDNVNNLSKDKYASSQEADEIEKLIDRFSAFAGHVGKPPEIARTLRSPAGAGEQPEQ
jgi:hypothetical protein